MPHFPGAWDPVNRMRIVVCALEARKCVSSFSTARSEGLSALSRRALVCQGCPAPSLPLLGLSWQPLSDGRGSFSEMALLLSLPPTCIFPSSVGRKCDAGSRCWQCCIPSVGSNEIHFLTFLASRGHLPAWACTLASASFKAGKEESSLPLTVLCSDPSLTFLSHSLGPLGAYGAHLDNLPISRSSDWWSVPSATLILLCHVG